MAGLREGQGVYTFANGGIFDGSYLDGEANGKGTFFFPDGAKYEGSWIDGKENGHGVFWHPNGEKYIGDWENGVLCPYRHCFNTGTDTALLHVSARL